MIRRWAAASSALCVSLALTAGGSPALAQNADCRFFKVQGNSLNVAKEPRADAPFVDVLDKNDIVCVTRDQQVGDRQWALVAFKLVKQKEQPVEGWAIMRLLQPATPEELAAARGTAPAAATQADTSGEEIVRFSEPIQNGAYPVVGRSLEELINGVPLFPPIEGLDDKLWKDKPCSTCHKWNRQTLCEQATLYAKRPAAAVRIRHPYGGPDKVAMTNWAKNGCQ